MTTLDLANNKLDALAPAVGKLANLKTLKLDHNRCVRLFMSILLRAGWGTAKSDCRGLHSQRAATKGRWQEEKLYFINSF